MPLYALKTGTSNTIANSNCVVWIPDNIQPGEQRPGAIFFYGVNETYELTKDFNALYKYGPAKYLKAGWKPPFIVVCVQQQVKWLTALQIDKIVTDTLAKFPVDSKMLVATGLSDGAITWNKYLANSVYVKKIKAAFLFSGSVSSAFLSNIPNMKSLYYRAWHSAVDTMVYPTSIKNAVPKMKEAGVNAVLTWYDGTPYYKGHGGWDQFYNPASVKQIWNWLQSKVTVLSPVVQQEPTVNDSATDISEPQNPVMPRVKKFSTDMSFTQSVEKAIYTNKTAGAKVNLPKPEDATGFEIKILRNRWQSLTFSEPLWFGIDDTDNLTVLPPGTYNIAFEDVEKKYYVINYSGQ